jgi:DNA-binding MarR family transcriptional regulator
MIVNRDVSLVGGLNMSIYPAQSMLIHLGTLKVNFSDLSLCDSEVYNVNIIDIKSIMMMEREQELNLALEAMHFGFRSMVLKPDQRLAELGMSRIHHRLLYFVGRNPDCSISQLLKILQVSKQYLNRPLKQLISQDYIDYRSDTLDKRIKRLTLTKRGAQLEQQLTGEQRRRFEEIFQQVGPEVEKNWRQVMHLLSENIDF